MKGIILAGGHGTRLYPITDVVNKQLLPVHDKPLIYYPLTTLISSGIKDIAIISSPAEIILFKNLLGDGTNFGVKIKYLVQLAPNGIPEAFSIAADFINGDDVTLILGDNIFVDSGEISQLVRGFKSGASVLGYQVAEPQHFGVIVFDHHRKPIAIEEKPKKPRSNVIIPGFYIYDNSVVAMCEKLKPSPRGELEITDLNNLFLKKQSLSLKNLSRGSVWIDAGTPSALSRASRYIAAIEETHGLKIGCPEEAALVRGFISKRALCTYLETMPDCEYRHYLNSLIVPEFQWASAPNIINLEAS